MSNATTLPDTPHLSDVIRAFPTTWPPLLTYHDHLLRHPDSPFSVAQRELIAAYTSSLNACAFCAGAHQIIAESFGVPAELLEDLMNDETHRVDAKLQPVLAFVKTLTQGPSRVRETQRQAIIDAGWPAQAIHDAAAICGLFNMMNRIVEGMGVVTNDQIQQQQRARHQHQSGATPSLTTYQDFGEKIFSGEL